MRKYLLITGLTLIILVFTFCATNEHAAIKSAKELKIDASEIGKGWEGYFYYMSDPAGEIKEFSEALEANKEKLKENVKEKLKGGFNEKTFQKNLERDKARFLKLGSKLEQCGVRDGYFLFLRKESPKSIAEVHVFVFNNANGAKEFYRFMKNKGYVSITSIGDEAAFYSGVSAHDWICRYSNAFVRVITYDGQNTGKVILEKIVSKVKK